MKTINLNLSYNLPETEKITSIELTKDYIFFAVNSNYQQGMEGQLRRIWGRIQQKLDDAKESVELEESEFNFILKEFDRAKFSPIVSKYVNILEDHLTKLSKS